MASQNIIFHSNKYHKIFILVILGLLYNAGPSASFSPLQIQPKPALLSENSHSVIPNANLRLPAVVKPSHYKIESRPILDEIEGETRFTAPGKVTITVLAIATSRNITLHVNSDRITINQENVKLRIQPSGDQLEIIGQYLEPEKEFYIIELSTALSINVEYELEIPYTAILPDTGWVGYYRAYYVNPETGNTHYMSTTKFEPYHARKAFPSFDEPALKAIFEVSLARRSNYSSLSNSIIRNTVADPNLPGWFWDHYEPTERMTTYLLCMIVSDFEYTEANPGIYSKPVKAWAPSHLIEGAKFVATTTATILSHYEKLFRHPYTFPKMDSIYIPQFPSGAMENWGLITYRVDKFMYYKGVSTEANRAQVASTVAHELSHQWFGNLVTCKWWSDIWLNEGFATYWKYFGLEASVPEFDPHNRFYIDSLVPAFNFDEVFIHPIRKSAENPKEISALFDPIIYQKAASVIRMVENIYGREVFHTALATYLEGTKYSNAEQDYLFRYLHTIQGFLPADLTIKDILDTWTLQSGYPLVRITKISKTRFYISQEKYARNNGASDSVQTEGFWNIPISIVSGSRPDFLDKKPKLWLRNNQLSVSYNIDESEAGDWLILNADATGFYRVLYSEDMFTEIVNQLITNASVISPLTRSQLIDNYFNFAAAGYVDVTQALRLTKYLGQETTLSAWTLLTSHMHKALSVFPGISAASSFKNYMLPKVENALKLIGLEQEAGDNGTDVIVRGILLNWACALEHTGCLNYASTLFRSWKDANDGVNPIPTDIQTDVYCGAISNPSSASEAFQFFYENYKREANPTLKARLLNALGCAKEGSMVELLLLDAFTPESGIAESDRPYLLRRLASHPSSRSATLGKDLLTPDVYFRVIATISDYVTLQEEIDQIQLGFDSNSDTLSDVRPDLNNSIRWMKRNVDWMSAQGNAMILWFNENLS